MTRAAWDATPTDYQGRLLLAALAVSQHRIPSDAKKRTVGIMLERQWIRTRQLATQPGGVDHVLTHHGVNAAQKVRTAQLAEKYPVGAAAAFTPEGATKRNVVVVNSGPDADGTVEVLSATQGGKALRAPLAALEELPELPPAPAGEPTDWWTITDAQGAELTRVKAGDDPGARKAAERHPAVVAAVRRDKGFAVRRLVTSELSTPVGKLRGLPRFSPAPAAEKPAPATPHGLGCLPRNVDVPQVKAALRQLTIDGQPLAAFNDAHQVVSVGAYLDPRPETGEVVLRFVTEHRPRPSEFRIPPAERERITQEYADLFHTAGWAVEKFRESGRLTAVILTPPAPAAH
ncbi:hypothetical protein ACF08W_29260 [Streptomyces sp. NPDC015144]|uniref:hypothetical protein n=1 Tax=Streptomyces sp. NPDC015144 TaxID=3364944 RepID=UPI003700C5BA